MATVLRPLAKPTDPKEIWRLWLVPGLVVGLILIASVTVLIPQFQALLDDNRAIESSEEELERLTEKREFLQSLSSAELTNYRDSLERVLPSQKPVFTLLDSFRVLAEEQNVLIGDYSLSPGLLAAQRATSSASTRRQDAAVEPGTRAKLDFTIDVDGRLEDVLRFLETFETLAPIITVDAIDISGEVTREDGDTDITATVTLAMNYSYPPVTGASPDRQLQALSPAERETLVAIDEYSTYADEAALSQPIIQYDRDNLFTY